MILLFTLFNLLYAVIDGSNCDPIANFDRCYYKWWGEAEDVDSVIEIEDNTLCYDPFVQLRQSTGRTETRNVTEIFFIKYGTNGFSGIGKYFDVLKESDASFRQCYSGCLWASPPPYVNQSLTKSFGLTFITNFLNATLLNATNFQGEFDGIFWNLYCNDYSKITETDTSTVDSTAGSSENDSEDDSGLVSTTTGRTETLLTETEQSKTTVINCNESVVPVTNKEEINNNNNTSNDNLMVFIVITIIIVLFLLIICILIGIFVWKRKKKYKNNKRQNVMKTINSKAKLTSMESNANIAINIAKIVEKTEIIDEDLNTNDNDNNGSNRSNTSNHKHSVNARVSNTHVNNTHINNNIDNKNGKDSKNAEINISELHKAHAALARLTNKSIHSKRNLNCVISENTDENDDVYSGPLPAPMKSPTLPAEPVDSFDNLPNIPRIPPMPNILEMSCADHCDVNSKPPQIEAINVTNANIGKESRVGEMSPINGYTTPSAASVSHVNVAIAMAYQSKPGTTRAGAEGILPTHYENENENNNENDKFEKDDILNSDGSGTDVEDMYDENLIEASERTSERTSDRTSKCTENSIDIKANKVHRLSAITNTSDILTETSEEKELDHDTPVQQSKQSKSRYLKNTFAKTAKQLTPKTPRTPISPRTHRLKKLGYTPSVPSFSNADTQIIFANDEDGDSSIAPSPINHSRNNSK